MSVAVSFPRSLPTADRQRRILQLVNAGGPLALRRKYHAATLRCVAGLVVDVDGRLELTPAGRELLGSPAPHPCLKGWSLSCTCSDKRQCFHHTDPEPLDAVCSCGHPLDEHMDRTVDGVAVVRCEYSEHGGMWVCPCPNFRGVRLE